MEIDYKYDVAFSFAGEDRSFVEQIVNELVNKGFKCFYDQLEEAELWGKDLYVYLDEIYRHKSKFCVMILSEFYAKKLWTNHERQSAQARAFKENKEYILPIKLDDTEIPGIRETIGYIDGNQKSIEEIVTLLIKKITGKKSINITESEEVDFIVPQIRRKINENEKKEFLVTGYKTIRDQFEMLLEKLAHKNDHVVSNFSESADYKFVCGVNVEGELKAACKIWISHDHFSGNQICFYINSRGVPQNDSTLNDWAVVDDDGIEMFFKISAMGIGYDYKKIDRNRATADDLAKYFWGRFIQQLNY